MPCVYLLVIPILPDLSRLFGTLTTTGEQNSNRDNSIFKNRCNPITPKEITKSNRDKNSCFAFLFFRCWAQDLDFRFHGSQITKEGSSPGGFFLFEGVIGGADQRAGFDVLESHRFAQALEFGKLVRDGRSARWADVRAWAADIARA